MENEYGYGEAVEFIEECELNGIGILGLDFLRRDEQGVTSMNSTTWKDLSPKESWRESRHLLKGGIPDGGNVVVFVTDES